MVEEEDWISCDGKQWWLVMVDVVVSIRKPKMGGQICVCRSRSYSGKAQEKENLNGTAAPAKLGNERILSNPMVSLNPLKIFTTPLPTLTKRIFENMDGSQRSTFCSQCSVNYEELVKLVGIEKSCSEAKQQAARPSLPSGCKMPNSALLIPTKKMNQSLGRIKRYSPS